MLNGPKRSRESLSENYLVATETTSPILVRSAEFSCSNVLNKFLSKRNIKILPTPKILYVRYTYESATMYFLEFPQGPY